MVSQALSSVFWWLLVGWCPQGGAGDWDQLGGWIQRLPSREWRLCLSQGWAGVGVGVRAWQGGQAHKEPFFFSLIRLFLPPS